jgi:alginate O-acetyltransferase complex protein AlgI
MLFTELRFVVFFATVYAVHWFVLRRQTSRKLLLLAASLVFYGAWDWRFLGLIAISAGIDYVAGLLIVDRPAQKKMWLTLSLVSNLGILGAFKYFNFFVESASALLTWLGLGALHQHLDVILPVGISFYTFQSMSYTIDVYRGIIKPLRSPSDFAFFVIFFPQLVAGPIVRAKDFLPQIDTQKSLATVRARKAVVLFLIGFFKKAVVSDRLAPVIDQVFASPENCGPFAAHIGVLLYTLQIYCDFSGYSDMAIATATLLGYELMQNFDFPYFSANITEFWRRWHISLSTWLRDYLYIPLGGNRLGRARTYVNLLATMLLGGLWHGAAWTFVVWGAMHGGALAAHRWWRERQPVATQRLRPLAVLATFYFVAIAWTFFRAGTWTTAVEVLLQFVTLRGPGSITLSAWWLLALAVLPIELALHRALLRPASALERVPAWAVAAAVGVASSLLLTLLETEHRPFIYFQF